MARRRARDPELTLFPFLSVLAAVMGTLILIITGMSQIGLANPKQRVEIEPFEPGKKSPVYVECRREGLLIHPDDPTAGEPVFVRRYAMDDAEGAWVGLRTRLQYDSARYLMMLVRSDGVGTFGDARATLGDTNIDVGYEPLFGAGDVRFHERRRGR